MRFKIIITSFAVTLFLSATAQHKHKQVKNSDAPLINAFCKAYSVKKCYKKTNFEDYRANGQNTVASMIPGETADLSMVFYRGQDYRVIVCAQEHIGPMEWNIINASGQVLFSNKDYDMTQDWDFSMSKTQHLKIEVTAPGNTEEGMGGEEGCVSLIIAHRQTPKKGFH